MSLGEGTTYWVCVDCYFAHHGLGDGEYEEGERRAAGIRLPEHDRALPLVPLSLITAEVVTSGTLEHQCDDPTDWCDCEEITFSWSPCQGCGSTLGGSRHALTVWSEAA